MASTLFVSCQKEEDSVLLTSANTDLEIEERSGGLFAGCYELVFPVTIQFPDSTIVSVSSEEELRAALKAWHESHPARPHLRPRPVLVFPFDVINEAGETITVESHEQLRELKMQCRPDVDRPHAWPGGHNPCYSLVFPVNIVLPNQTEVTVNSYVELNRLWRRFHHVRPGALARPMYVYPITVVLQDSTQVELLSVEDLKAVLQDCRG